jgi:hypothetical protein
MNDFEDFDASYQQWMDGLEQREAAIVALIADDMRELARDNLPLADILRDGCTGYDHMPDVELLDEIKTRGLTL